MAKVFTIISQQTPSMATFAGVGSGGAATIGVGTPTYAVDATAASPWLGTVAIATDGAGTTSTGRFTGIAKGVSTDTASAAGTVELWQPLPGIIYSGFGKTYSTVDTAAEILALRGKRVVFDLTTGDWTIDNAATDAVINCVVLTGEGNPTTGTISFVYASHGTYLDFAVSA